MHRITLIWYLDIHNLTNKFSWIILAYFFFNFCSKIRFLLLWNDLFIPADFTRTASTANSAFSAHSFLAGWKCLPFCCFCLLGLVLLVLQSAALFCLKWLENLKLGNKNIFAFKKFYHFCTISHNPVRICGIR